VNQTAAVDAAIAGLPATRNGHARVPRFPSETPETVTVERVGLGFHSMLSSGLELRLDHIRGHREVTGELIVQHGRDDRIFAGNFNASSPTARTTISKELARTGSMNAGTWREVLESFCIGVLAEHRRPMEMVNLASLGPRPGSKTLVGPALPIGHITTLMGTEGSGKSTAARFLAVSLRTGRETIPGWQPHAKGRVVVVDYEGDAHEWAEGIGQISAGLGIAMPDVDYLPCAWSGALYDQVEQLAADVARIQPVCVIVDSAELAGGVGHEGDSFEARTQRLYSALKLLRTTVLVIDHLASMERDGSGPASKAYGSVFKMAWSRQVWELKRERAAAAERAELLLLNTKYNAGPKSKPLGLALTYAGEKLTIERADVLAPELQGAIPVHERMTRLLRNGSLTVAAISKELDKPDTYVRQLVSRYKDRFIRLPDQRIGLVGHV
jgi:hypothetical protein